MSPHPSEQLEKAEEWAAKILPDVEHKSQQYYGRRDRFGGSSASKWQGMLESRLDGGDIFRGSKRTEPKPREGGWSGNLDMK
jgi:hypothetical protein